MAEQETLRKLLQKRKGHRLVVRNAISKARELLSQTKDDAVTPTTVKLKLETVRNTIDQKQSIIATLNEEIEDLYSEDEIEKEITDRSDFEDEVEKFYVTSTPYSNSQIRNKFALKTLDKVTLQSN